MPAADASCLVVVGSTVVLQQENIHSGRRGSQQERVLCECVGAVAGSQLAN